MNLMALLFINDNHIIVHSHKYLRPRRKHVIRQARLLLYIPCPQNSSTPILQATGSLLYKPIVFVYVVIYAKLWLKIHSQILNHYHDDRPCIREIHDSIHGFKRVLVLYPWRVLDVLLNLWVLYDINIAFIIIDKEGWNCRTRTT